MTETALIAALARRNSGRPPVWMMRQAGRYHAHYQSLKRYVDFLTLCRDPAWAAETFRTCSAAPADGATVY